MASPPNYNMGFSPPAPTHLSLPKPKVMKRPSDINTSAPPQKRRKASIAYSSFSTSSHPLRQTSFPPDGLDNGARSPSIDDMSMISGSIAPGATKGKRGRKPKKTAVQDDEGSLVNGRASTVLSARGSKGKGRNRANKEDDEDDLDEDDTPSALVTITARTAEEKEKEKQHRALLVGAFDDQQFSRFEIWRSSKLTEGVVRRLVNQTLSQSVPVPVILAVKSVAKLFAGELIEKARKVQSEWLALSGEDQALIPSTTTSVQSSQENALRLKDPSLAHSSSQWGGLSNDNAQTPVKMENSADRGRTFLPSAKSEEEAEHRKEMNRTLRGPLTPDHLREAMRRIKMERAGGVGLLGLGRLQHSSGQERFGFKTGGRRLFR